MESQTCGRPHCHTAALLGCGLVSPEQCFLGRQEGARVLQLGASVPAYRLGSGKVLVFAEWPSLRGRGHPRCTSLCLLTARDTNGAFFIPEDLRGPLAVARLAGVGLSEGCSPEALNSWGGHGQPPAISHHHLMFQAVSGS